MRLRLRLSPVTSSPSTGLRGRFRTARARQRYVISPKPRKCACGPLWTPEKRDAFGKTVIDMLSEYSPDLKDLILHMEVRTPHELEEEVGLTEGNIFQGELTMDQIMFNRPTPGYAQYRMPVKHLYMCGSSTHPGGGVMGAPGANAAREVIADMRAGRKA